MQADLPATVACARVSRAGTVLGVLGLASGAVAPAGLIESWRVSPHTAVHQFSIVGQELSYPAANLAAIVVLLLALVGLVATTSTVLGAAREVLADRRFVRRMAALQPGPRHGALVFEAERPLAFCAGLLKPRTYISSGAMALLDEPALTAVLLHELQHARRRDPLRLAVGRVLARALFFMPGLGRLAQRQQELAELSADECVVNGAADNRSALARAMLMFSDAPRVGGSAGIDPARIDYLLGEVTNLGFPVFTCLSALLALALLAGTALLAARVATGSASLALPLLSRQPCVVVLAMIPTGVVLIGHLVARRLAGEPPP